MNTFLKKYPWKNLSFGSGILEEVSLFDEEHLEGP